MSGTVNPAFESNELNTLETGHLTDEPTTEGKDAAGRSSNCLDSGHKLLDNFFSSHKKLFKSLLLILLNLVTITYFIFATIYWTNHNYKNIDWCNGYGMLIILFTIVYGGILYSYTLKCFGKALDRHSQPLQNTLRRFHKKICDSVVIQAVIYICVFVAIVVFLVIDTKDAKERLMSGVGIIVLISFGWIFSKYPARINWRIVFSGLILQFLLGLLTIRWTVGRSIFQCFADKAVKFLNFTKAGASFIYSEKLVDDGVFAFSVMPIIFYFCSCVQILYYLGVMQWIIYNLGRILQTIMGTTICESVCCAANIFVGMTEAPLIIRPYLSRMTSSELHTVMCAGFSMISGTVLAAYIKFGAHPAHLITASLMAAPASLCYSKLFYPETEKIVVTPDCIKLVKSKDSNFMDAASKGAITAIPLIFGIIANIIAFVSLVALINSLLSWIGMLVGYEQLSFELILSKLFMPLSWIIGVPWEHCEDVATLIGLKTAVNEFVAYEMLGKYKKQGRIFGRTEAIATFAICGFANPSSIGITLSTMTSLVPERRETVMKSVLRAFLAGCIVCLLTASFAGLLISDDYYDLPMDTLALNATAS